MSYVLRSMFSLGVLVLVGGMALAQTSFPETEPNGPKTEANAVTFGTVGDSVTGNSQGTSITAGNSAATSADTFLITLPVAAAGIYRNRLVITTAGTAGHTGTIRGLSQSSGVIGTNDNTAQASSATTTPARFNQWYSFGKGERLYYRVAGTTGTTSDYTATWEREVVTPIVLGNFAEGTITINSDGQGHTTDTDMWVYDANFDPIPGYGNDDTPANARAVLTRTFTAGTYYIAISNFNLANDQASPVDDAFRSGTVTDFAGLALNSSTTTALNVAFAITDANGTTQFPATKVGAYDIVWAQFTVGSAVPEPTTLILGGLGFGGALLAGRKKLAQRKKFSQ